MGTGPCVLVISMMLYLIMKKVVVSLEPLVNYRSRQALELYGLADLGFEGYHFTWTNGRQEEANIQCRLDRGLAYASFIS